MSEVYSTITLIKSSQLLPERNFKLESLDDISLFADGGHTTITSFQYIKHALNLTLKVDASQSGLNYTNTNNINYLIIQNSITNATKVGYFVINKKWVSQETIQFELVMDTINTFLDSIELSDKTKILRQHKDRFYTQQEDDGFSNLESIECGLDSENYAIYTRQSCLVEEEIKKNYIFDLDEYRELSTRNFEIRIKCEDFDLIDIRIRAFTLDSNYKIKRVIDDESVNDYWCNLENEEITSYDDTHYQLSEDEKFLAFRVEMQINIVFDPDDPTYEDIVITFGLNDPEEYTPEELSTTLTELDGIKDIIWFTADFSDVQLWPIIDMYSEGITPQLYGKEIQELHEDLNYDWYLIYMNQNEPSDSLVNPVNTYLVASDNVVITNYDNKFQGNWGNNVFRDNLTPTEILNTPLNPCYFIHGSFNDGAVLSGTFTRVSDSETLSALTIYKAYDYIMYLYRIFEDGDYRYFVVINQVNVGTQSVAEQYLYECTDLSGYLHYEHLTIVLKGDYITNTQNSRQYAIATELMGNTISFHYLSKYNWVDRTQAKLIKIIEMPYLPAILRKNNNIVGYSFTESKWQFENVANIGQVMKLSSNNEKLEKNILFTLNANNPFKILNNRTYTYKMTELRNKAYETKLYHSDFYQPKFIYDSFGFIFQCELMNEYSHIHIADGQLNVNYHVSTTINSRFMFEFVNYNCDSRELQDYNKVMCIARNNEMPLYNQQYINYLRVGYNYEVKNKQRTEAFSWLGAGLSIAGAVASFASSVYTGGFGVAMGVSLTTTALGTIANAINTTITAERNMQMKQDQLKNQTTSVYGSDDVDIMNAYAKNRLKLKLYKVSERMEQLLFDLFYYTGYLFNTIGLPDTTSRSRFNFVCAEIVLKKTPNLSDEIVRDIKARYNAGITFLHKYNNTYDFDQKYENWEWSVINAIGGE